MDQIQQGGARQAHGHGEQGQQQHEEIPGPHHPVPPQGQRYGVPVPFGLLVVGESGDGHDGQNNLDKGDDEAVVKKVQISEDDVNYNEQQIGL